MAQNLQLLKRRIKTAKNVSQIAKAMEMMAASKIKRAQKTVENNKPYAKKIEGLTASLIKNVGEKKFNHPYVDGNSSPKKLLIAISPERGLCGSLNTNLLKKLLSIEDENTMVVSVGKKMERFAAKSKCELVASFPMETSIPRYTLVYDLMRMVDELYKSGKVGSVEILFTEFVSFFAQIPTIRKILPIDTQMVATEEELFHLFEPKAEALLETLLPQYLEVAIYSSLLEAYTSEQVARMIAMQNAKNNANDIGSALILLHNKTRQEKITGEILDLSNNQL